MKVRVSTMLWLQATMASAIATFESVAEYAFAAVFLAVWLTYIRRAVRRLPISRVYYVSCFAVVGSVVAFYWMDMTRHYEPQRVDDCRRRMTKLAEALWDYREEHHALPVAQQDNDGVLRSWRVAIYPYLLRHEHQQSGTAGVTERDISCTDGCFSSSPFGASASYFAVLGPRAAWSTLQATHGTIRDKPAETILLLEELGRGFQWDDPRDLEFEEALQFLSQPVGSRYVHLGCGRAAYFEKKNPNRTHEGVHAVFADGCVRFIPVPLPRELAMALLTSDGGEDIPADAMKMLWKPEIDYGKIASFGFFVACCLSPGLRLRRTKSKPNGQT